MVDLTEYALRACPDPQVVREVHPSDGACLIHQKLGGTCDITAILARGGMQDSIAADCVGLRIGQKRKSIGLAFAQLVQVLTRIRADCQNLHTPRPKVRKMPLETP